MVMISKKEWHQVSSEYLIDLTVELLGEIYPDKDEEELATLLKEIEDGEADIDVLMADANDNDVEIEWNHEYDDWWTHRKGGYEITYELSE